MKNKNIVIIGIILVIFLIGSGIFLTLQKPMDKLQPAVQKTTEDTTAGDIIEDTLKGLMAGGKTTKCTFEIDSEGTEVSGQVYVDNGKIRQDYQAIHQDGRISGHMILDLDTAYVWTDEMNQGFKFSIEDQDASEFQEEQASDINKPMKFQCSPWIADNSIFVVPSNISFQTMSLPTMPENAEIGGNASEGIDFEDKCSLCDTLPEGSDRNACKSQLGCM